MTVPFSAIGKEAFGDLRRRKSGSQMLDCPIKSPIRDSSSAIFPPAHAQYAARIPGRLSFLLSRSVSLSFPQPRAGHLWLPCLTAATYLTAKRMFAICSARMGEPDFRTNSFLPRQWDKRTFNQPGMASRASETRTCRFESCRGRQLFFEFLVAGGIACTGSAQLRYRRRATK
jgi:hypothetical protein